MSYFSAIIAVIKAIPAIKEWWDSLIAFYIDSQIETMKQENRDAIRKAINEHDQRDLEKALGSTKSGEKSNLPGAVIVGPGDLPGVSNPKRD